jgi:hypothetical protein
MSIWDEGLSRLFGVDVPDRSVERLVSTVIVVCAVAFPLTFRHALEDYARRTVVELQVQWRGEFKRMVNQISPSQANSVNPAGHSRNGGGHKHSGHK